MDNLPETQEDKALYRFWLTAIFTGLMLINRNPDISTLGLVDDAEGHADELLRRIPPVKPRQ